MPGAFTFTDCSGTFAPYIEYGRKRVNLSRKVKKVLETIHIMQIIAFTLISTFKELSNLLLALGSRLPTVCFPTPQRFDADAQFHHAPRVAD